jgi:hypothetical protein
VPDVTFIPAFQCVVTDAETPNHATPHEAVGLLGGRILQHQGAGNLQALGCIRDLARADWVRPIMLPKDREALPRAHGAAERTRVDSIAAQVHVPVHGPQADKGAGIIHRLDLQVKVSSLHEPVR